jgi:hypothetical protein
MKAYGKISVGSIFGELLPAVRITLGIEKGA